MRAKCALHKARHFSSFKEQITTRECDFQHSPAVRSFGPAGDALSRFEYKFRKQSVESKFRKQSVEFKLNV